MCGIDPQGLGEQHPNRKSNHTLDDLYLPDATLECRLTMELAAKTVCTKFTPAISTYGKNPEVRFDIYEAGKFMTAVGALARLDADAEKDDLRSGTTKGLRSLSNTLADTGRMFLEESSNGPRESAAVNIQAGRRCPVVHQQIEKIFQLRRARNHVTASAEAAAYALAYCTCSKLLDGLMLLKQDGLRFDDPDAERFVMKQNPAQFIGGDREYPFVVLDSDASVGEEQATATGLHSQAFNVIAPSVRMDGSVGANPFANNASVPVAGALGGEADGAEGDTVDTNAIASADDGTGPMEEATMNYMEEDDDEMGTQSMIIDKMNAGTKHSAGLDEPSETDRAAAMARRSADHYNDESTESIMTEIQEGRGDHANQSDGASVDLSASGERRDGICGLDQADMERSLDMDIEDDAA